MYLVFGVFYQSSITGHLEGVHVCSKIVLLRKAQEERGWGESREKERDEYT